MSGTAVTEMQIQIVIHGEAFCPSMMTKETPFANRKLLLEEITNNERNEMEEGQMEEIEIKEGHDDVEEEQSNKKKNKTSFTNRKLLLEEITNNERNEIEEGQMEENEIKEGHEDVEEEQEIEFLNDLAHQCLDDFDDMWFLNDIDDQCLDYFDDMWNRRRFLNDIDDQCLDEFDDMWNRRRFLNDIDDQCLDDFDDMWNRRRFLNDFDDECLDDFDDMWNRRLYCSRYTSRYFVMEEGQIEEYKTKERQKKVCSEAVICNFVIKEGQMEEYKKKERQKEAKETPFANRKLLLEKITNNERNEMEEGEMEENEIKEGHDDVEEKQGNNLRIAINNSRKDSDYQLIYEFAMWSRRLIFESPFIWNLLNVERGQVEENKIKEGQEEVQEEQDNELKILRKAFGQSKRVNVITINVARRASRFLYKYMEDLEYLSKRFLKQQIQDVWQLSRCKVCLDSDACMVFFPCRHMATCEYCGSFLDQCPVCRTFIEETVKVNKK